MAVKTRFNFQFEGESRQIVSVRERSNGDLIVMPKSGTKFINANTGPRLDHLATKFSIHVSPNSDGHLIKQLVHLADNRKIKNSALIKPGPEGFIWPFFYERPLSMKDAIYSPSSNTKDRQISVGEVDFFFSPIFCLVALGKEVGDILLPPPFDCVRVSFSYFDLLFACTQMHCPPLPVSQVLISRTSAETVDDELPSWQTEGGVQSFSRIELGVRMREALKLFSIGYMEQLARQNWGLSKEDIAEITQDSQWFSNFASVKKMKQVKG